MIKRKAFTMVELLIAGTILASILGFAFSFIRDTQRQAALATAIGTLRQEAQMVLRAMERDVTACLIEQDGFEDDGTEKYKPKYTLGNAPSFTIAKEDDNANKPLFDTETAVEGEEIGYSVNNDGVCKRNGQTIAHCVDSINVEEGDSNSSDEIGKVKITVNMKTDVPGFKDPASYTQSVVVGIRQLEGLDLASDKGNRLKGRNKRWRQHIEGNN